MGDGTDGPTRLEAVVDRIVDGTHAVLLVGEGEVELVVPVTWLPAGAGEGSLLALGLDLDPGAGAARADELRGRLGGLRGERSRPGRFDDGRPPATG